MEGAHSAAAPCAGSPPSRSILSHTPHFHALTSKGVATSLLLLKSKSWRTSVTTWLLGQSPSETLCVNPPRERERELY